MILTIDDKNYTSFIGYNIRLVYNSIGSAFTFQAKDNIFTNPLSYSDCKLTTDDGDLLLTGTILFPKYKLSKEPDIISLSGYSKSGILDDVNIPILLYPLQFDNMSLKEIVNKIFPAFNVNYIIDDTVKSVMSRNIEKTNSDYSQTVSSFITSLAVERGIFITHNEKGEVIFKKINAKKLQSVKFFNENNLGDNDIELEVNGQEMHSQITVMRQATDENPDGGQETISNPYISKFRPKVVILNSGNIFDVGKAARMELSKNLRSISLNIDTDEFIKPGNLITVQYKDLNINKPTEFFVESTNINGSEKTETYTLNCKLKDVYTDSEPQNIFI